MTEWIESNRTPSDMNATIAKYSIDVRVPFWVKMDKMSGPVADLGLWDYNLNQWIDIEYGIIHPTHWAEIEYPRFEVNQ